MPTLLAQQCETILDAASRSDIGLQVYAPDASAFDVKRTLYRFRRELANGAFAHLQIRLCPHDPDHRVWVINRPELIPQGVEPEDTIALEMPTLEITF